jgi:hypothetical protein
MIRDTQYARMAALFSEMQAGETVLATLSIVSNIMDRKEEERAVIVHML